MSMRKVKCKCCGLTDTPKKDMSQYVYYTDKGNEVSENVHKDCYEQHVKNKEFYKKEYIELDSLYETIMRIHQLKSFPPNFFPMIQELRNGTILVGRKKKKKYKEGYPYPLIEKTYEYCQESIEYWKKNKEFTTIMQELMYCWMIINSKIIDVKKRDEKKELLKAKKKAEEKQEAKLDGTTHQNKENVTFKKQKREDDLSAFL